MIKTLNLIGSPVLNKKCVPVVPVVPLVKDNLSSALEIDVERVSGDNWPEEIRDLVQDLKDTAESLGDDCLGLAANQIWDKETPCPAVFVVKAFLKDPETDKQVSYFQEMINPFVRTSGPKVRITEGCLSVPNYKKTGLRSETVSCTMQTLVNVVDQTMRFNGKHNFMSFVLQHEYDHILGKLIKHE